MFKEILKALGSIIWDGAKFIGKILSGVFLFGYIFSGYGLIFLLPTLPTLLGSTPYTLEWLLCLIFVVSIIGSWIGLLIIEVRDRIDQKRRNN